MSEPCYRVGQVVTSTRGHGSLIVAMADPGMDCPDNAIATTDGAMFSSGGIGWCICRDRVVGHFEYFGPANAGVWGIYDAKDDCRGIIDIYGPPSRVTSRPAWVDEWAAENPDALG